MERRGVVALIILALLLAVLIAYATCGQEETQTEPTQVNLIYGLRLQSDMLFYATVGALAEKADAGIGIGWNNSVWVGVHFYFYENEGLAAFSGLELHILYPPEGTIEFHPSLPIGFALTKGKTITTVSAVITPAPTGQPVGAIFALAFQMKL